MVEFTTIHHLFGLRNSDHPTGVKRRHPLPSRCVRQVKTRQALHVYAVNGLFFASRDVFLARSHWRIMFWSKSESPIRILGTLRILRSNGEETLLSFGDTDTVLALKRRLRELLVTGSEPELVTGKELTPPCSAMRLIFGTDVLLDNWVLGDHGVVDGDQLTLVFSHAPLGKFDCVLETDDPDTWTLATASFAQEGDCCISIVEEDMISIDIEDEYDEYDPYLNGSKWEHWYNGPVEVTGSQLCIVVESSHRLGLFDSIPEPGVLLGEILCQMKPFNPAPPKEWLLDGKYIFRGVYKPPFGWFWMLILL